MYNELKIGVGKLLNKALAIQTSRRTGGITEIDF